MPIVTYSLVDIVNAIELTLSAAASLATHRSYDELREGIAPADVPQLQVYPEANMGTSAYSETDRKTFGNKTTGKKVSIKEYLIYADYYASVRPSTSIGEDMGRLVPGIDELEDILDSQMYPSNVAANGCFGIPWMDSFQWSWERVVFTWAATSYIGARFSIIFRAS